MLEGRSRIWPLLDLVITQDVTEIPPMDKQTAIKPDSFDPSPKLKIKFCLVLHLDPAQTTTLTLTLTPKVRNSPFKKH